MGLEVDLKALGFKLSRPIMRDSYDFAYRTEGIREFGLMRGQALLQDIGVLDVHEIGGYTNVQVDLWQLHAQQGWPEASYLAIQSSGCFEKVALRATYLSHLLSKFGNAPVGPLDQDLRELLQRIHFPALYQSKGDDLGQYFWAFTLSQDLRHLPDFTKGQIYSICRGFCECSKTGTCAQ